MGNTISSKVVAQKALTEPYSRNVVKGDTKDAACSSPAVGTSSGLPTTPSGQTDEETYGLARFRIVANLPSGLASTPSNDRVLERSLHLHLRRAWAIGNTISSKVVVRNALTDPHSRIAVKGDA